MKVKTPRIGGICRSIQGRDKGRCYIIKALNPDGSVMVADGNFKRLASPKKKNLKHLWLLPDISESIAEKLQSGKQVFDTEIYSALRAYNSAEADGGDEGKDGAL